VLIDDLLPHPIETEHHETLVDAPPTIVYEQLLKANLAASPIVSLLVMARGTLWPLAARLKVGPPITIHGLEGVGFRVVAEHPGREIVLGIIGKFWTPRGSLRRFDPKEFAGFDEPGYAVAAWNFVVEPEGEGTRLITETRIRCTDETAEKRFRTYWTLVKPFSGWIRSEILRTTKKAAEG
jgi:hypothetical protein